MNRSPTLTMSHIIAHDAPLLSPSTDAPAPWDAIYAPTTDAFAHYYAAPSPSSSASASPTPATRMLKMRMSPDSLAEADQQQLCLPTHQVFDFPELAPAGTPGPQKQERLSISINAAAVAASVASKRSASPAPSLTKKPRAAGERINSKDFIPPDVSGLSKREARLVKNRAAAFLSRQRKREEFELMEVRVAELEQENARLLALTQSGSSGNASQTSSTPSDNVLLTQIEELNKQLAAAKERERELTTELAKSKVSAPPAIKVEETADLQLPLSPVRSSATSPHKSGASLGLMVLLCALPTLLSMPMNSALPKSFAIPDAPLPAAPAAFDFNSFISNDYDWTRTSGNNMMDLDDLDMGSVLSSTPASQKLEFATSGVTDAENALAGLDISFDTVPADNGKIRVRIHPSSAVSSRAASPGASSFSDTKSEVSSPWNTESEPTVEAAFMPSSLSSSSSLSTLSPSLSSPSSYLAPPSPGGDPFLGIGAGSDYMPYSSEMSDMFGMDDSLSGTGDLGQDMVYGSEYSGGDNAKRRVRIALKSMPSAGGEGGEWEVQIC
ncbi:hypothetical protein DXG01_004972 [Tephrocybe rancida]|nr:hypothetical protein DXG01_004972 [Tephrocybe rancida]